MHASKVIDEIVRQGVAPFMKELGFSKKGNTWWQSYERVIEVIDIQKDRFNDGFVARFTVNLGLYWPEVQKAIAQEARSFPPKTPDCTVSERLGLLFDEGRDFWWTVGPQTDVHGIGRDCVVKIQDFGIPWLRSGHDLSTTLSYARKRPYTIVMKRILAELEKVCLANGEI